MESSRQFPNDSFSTGWLINIKSSMDLCNESHRSIDTQDCSSFIEMEPDLFSMRWSSNDANDFDFRLPRSQPSALVHADQIISNGHLLPFQVSGSTNNSFSSAARCRSQSDSSTSVISCRMNSASSSPAFYSSHSTPNSVTSYSSKSLCSRSRNYKSPVIKNCVKLSKKILFRYLNFLMPLYKKVRNFNLNTLKLPRNCKTLTQNSPRMSNGFTGIEWCRSNADISIYDAILHCKRSNGHEK